MEHPMRHFLFGSIPRIVLFALFLTPITALAGAHEDTGLTKGQTVYVPAYSHIYSGNKDLPSLLAVTLSIRNTDPNHPMELLAVEYYDTQGKLLKKFIALSTILNAMGSTRYTIPLSDKGGGSGANFIVKWQAGRPINPPIIESIMIGPRTSFTSRGQAVIPSK